MSKKALVVGATGLVGKALIKLLVEKEYYSEIIVVSRRPLELESEKLKTIILKDFDQLESIKDQLNVHDYYCTLGTTRKKAGSKLAFLKVDLEYPLALALLARDQPDFEQFLVVTSLGANPNSPLFYNATKGQLEQELEKLQLKSLKIFQPSLLLGAREEFRPLEWVGKVLTGFLSFFAIGSKKPLWSIHGHEVAEAMYQVARKNEAGVERYKPSDMLQFVYTWSS